MEQICKVRYRHFIFQSKWKKKLLFLVLLWWWFFSLPGDLFERPTSTAVFDKNGQLLGARIASDGQFRFGSLEKVPDKFALCIKEFEDRNFDHHIGIDPKGILRALNQNIKKGKIVSGASTISMQVIRLSRDNPRRTYLEKVLEMARALRLELRYSKDEILSFYADQAPMGGNVVGLETAAWRYFKKRPKDLSWAESATLAVLPNAPSIIFPGTRNDKLKLKRNRLLHRLYELDYLDEISYELSIAEDVPQRPNRLPMHSSHLLNLLEKEGKLGESVQTSIDINLQERVIELSRYHMEHWEANFIFNCSVLITEVTSGDVVAYMGNLHDAKDNSYVDVIQSQRSTGSILKPLLYSSMLEDGEILPNQLIPDVPTNIAGYKPVNFHETFDGAVPASECLIRSLNIPSVLMLRQHGVQKFHQQLKLLGFNQMNRASNHYGLSLILGGAETNLWELNRAYGFLANRLIHFNKESGSYPIQPYSLSVFPEQADAPIFQDQQWSASTIHQCFESMMHLNRPKNEMGWEHFSSSKPVAWKTGTSFGHRDAWAVGITPEYVVSVWVGNASGEGRPGLTGAVSAGPILFDIIDLLPNSNWFMTPYDDLSEAAVCSSSGMLAGPNCQQIDTLLLGEKGLAADVCCYHQVVHTNDQATMRVHKGCFNGEIVSQNWFVLPPKQAQYYRLIHPEYKPLPQWSAECIGSETEQQIQLIYPPKGSDVTIPINLSGQRERLVLEAAHALGNSTLYWSLGEEYLGSTSSFHKMEVAPNPGTYLLTITDQQGSIFEQKITFTKGLH